MNTKTLLDRVAQGDQSAVTPLLHRHRDRLCQMVAVRMDDRLTARFDPSDVVQEALLEAHQRLPRYLETRPVPFYPWLRNIAWEKLVHLHRQHRDAQRRTVCREVSLPDLSGQSRVILAERFALSMSTPSEQCVRQEVRLRVSEAIDALPLPDQEIITLKHLEELSFKEAAAVLKISEQAVYSRYRRAVEKLQQRLEHDPD
jgi:RNA polymerase sigma-70 factor (ECF subfamily)